MPFQIVLQMFFLVEAYFEASAGAGTGTGADTGAGAYP